MSRLTEIVFEHDGKRMNALAWCKELGFDRRKLCRRLDRLGVGGKFEDLFYTGSFEKRNLITYKGETHDTYGWDRKFGYPLETVGRRLRRGWTMEEIERNYRSDTKTFHHITHNGITDTERGWAARNGVDYALARCRMKKLGWSKEEALGFKKHESKCVKPFTYRGVRRSIAGWARLLGMDPVTISNRIKAYEAGRITKAEVVSKNEPGTVLKTVGRVMFHGKKCKLKTLLEICPVNKCTYFARIRNGWSVEKAIETPPTDTGFSTRVRKQRMRELRKMGVLV